MPPTVAMMDIIVKIMIEVLSMLAVATKEIKQRRASKLTLSVVLCPMTYAIQKDSFRG